MRPTIVEQVTLLQSNHDKALRVLRMVSIYHDLSKGPMATEFWEIVLPMADKPLEADLDNCELTLRRLACLLMTSPASSS